MRLLLLLTMTLLIAAPAQGQECSAGAKLEATECGWVSFEGCCDGERLLFCEGGMLCARDCAGFPHCGWNGTMGYYDCGTAGQDDPVGMFPAACPAGGRGVTDAVTGPGGDGVDLDAVTVPDLAHAPSSCSTIQGLYDVAASDCGIFSARFGIKQRGCVAVLVDLVGGDRPAARVTKSGLSFDFMDAGLVRSCLGQIDGDAIGGECVWTGGACSFSFEAAPEPEPAPSTDGGGGCGRAPADPPLAAFLLLAMLIVLPARRTTTTRYN